MDIKQKREYKRQLKTQGKKQCSKCATVMLIKDFDFRITNGNQCYRSDCKACRAIYNANYYKTKKNRSK